jgi:hypothetical protein
MNPAPILRVSDQLHAAASNLPVPDKEAIIQPIIATYDGAAALDILFDLSALIQPDPYSDQALKCTVDDADFPDQG